MTEQKVLELHLRDHLGYPPYYSMKRDYILEYSWEHWAVQELITRLRIYKDEEPINVIRGFNDEMENYIKRSKSNRAQCLFITALAIGKDAEDFLRASREESKC
jgi:hypothetical protein